MHLPLLARRARLGLAAGLLAGAAVAAEPAAMPAPFTATYTLRVNGVPIGRMTRTHAAATDGAWTFRSESRASGVAGLFRKDRITEESRWTVAAGRVLPAEYSYRQTGGRKERSVTVRFDRTAGRIETTVNSDRWRMPDADGVLDKLLYQLVLMRDLAAGMTQLDYRIADGGRIKDYRLVVVGNERLPTALGELDTVRVVRQRSDSKRETTLWCAPSLAFLPVRVDYREKDGGLTRVTLDSVTGLPLAGTP